MSGAPSTRARRSGVVVNYASVLLVAAIFCVGEYGQWTAALIAAEVAALVILGVSLHVTLIRTGFWSLTHTDVGKLDEREIQVTHTALRYSYAALSTLSLVMFWLVTISVRFSLLSLTHRGHFSLGLIAVLCLTYLIETLPASILAWSETNTARG